MFRLTNYQSVEKPFDTVSTLLAGVEDEPLDLAAVVRLPPLDAAVAALLELLEQLPVELHDDGRIRSRMPTRRAGDRVGRDEVVTASAPTPGGRPNGGGAGVCVTWGEHLAAPRGLALDDAAPIAVADGGRVQAVRAAGGLHAPAHRRRGPLLFAPFP